MTNQDAVLAVLHAAQLPVARFARTSYETDGRGAVLIAVPRPPSAFVGTAIIATDMRYYPLDDVRAATTDLEGDARVDANILIRMVETYDPACQAVVNVTVGDGNPVSVKLRLERPNVVDEADGVH